MRRQRSTSFPVFGEVASSALEPDGAVSSPFDAFENIVNRRSFSDAFQFEREVLLQRFTLALGALLKLGVHGVRHISHKNVRHAYIVLSVVAFGNSTGCLAARACWAIDA